MIDSVYVSAGAPPAAWSPAGARPADHVTLIVTGDPETIAAIADDLTSRMLGQPSAAPEPDTRTMDGMADGKALSAADLIDMREGSTVWARPFARAGGRPVRWRLLRSGRWQSGDAVVGGLPGVTPAWLVDERGPVTFDRPPGEVDRSDDAEVLAPGRDDR
jgi:hypothetical protein